MHILKHICLIIDGNEAVTFNVSLWIYMSKNLEAGSPPSQQFNSISYRKVYSEVLAFNYNKMKSK
jgi:hypothetical protein